MAARLRPLFAGGGLAGRAYHEAGHCVVSLDLGETVQSVSIRHDAFGLPGGHVVSDCPWWKGAATPEPDLVRTAIHFLSGVAADAIVEHGRLHGSLPSRRETKAAVRRMIRLHKAYLRAGFGSADVERAWTCVPRKTSLAARWRWLANRTLDAAHVLRRRWHEVEALRRALMRREAKGRLSGVAVERAIRDANAVR